METYQHLIGGITGGVVSTLVCHPLDLLRIRYSADEGGKDRPHYRSYADALRRVAGSGGVRGLYQGLAPNLIAAPLAWGLYFHLYDRLHSLFPDDDRTRFSRNLAVGCAAGGLVMGATNPLWVAKTRLCLQYEGRRRRYAGLADCLARLWREEGLRGLYKGLVPGLLGTVNGAVQFALYNFLKHERNALAGDSFDAPLSSGWYLLFSACSKVMATVLTFPYQVLRTRLQDHNVVYAGVADVCGRTWRAEGLRGFYKGMLMATLKQLPAVVVVYLVYEHSRRLLAAQ